VARHFRPLRWVREGVWPDANEGLIGAVDIYGQGAANRPQVRRDPVLQVRERPVPRRSGLRGDVSALLATGDRGELDAGAVLAIFSSFRRSENHPAGQHRHKYLK